MRLAGIALLGAVLAGGAMAEDSSQGLPRVAIVADHDSSDFSALIVADLSQEQGVSLVEREEMAKIGDELKLQQLVGTNPVSLGKLLGADGLLFLGKTKDGFQIRFTAVGLGYALFDDPLPVAATTDLPHLAQSLAQRIEDYSPKLKVKPDAAIPISVLNIRADSSSADSAALERKLSLLLESRLSALPQYIVLERRHASALHFEDNLSLSTALPLQGAYLVDGSFHASAQDKVSLTVDLRLRTPGNQQNQIKIEGSLKDLPGLAEQMTDALQKAIGTPANSAPWQPQNEAREYLLEGIWGSQHGASADALEALDSAELLGETAPDLLAVRISALCANVAGSERILMGDATTPDDPHPEARIEMLMRAIADEARYEQEGMEAKLILLDHRGFAQTASLNFRMMIDRTASSLLAMLDGTHDPHADEVRSALCSFAHYDPLHGQMPEDFDTALRHADDWSISADEEVAYYRNFRAPNNIAWFVLESQLDPESFCARFIPDPDQRRSVFFKFLNDLADNPGTKAIGLLELAKWTAPPQQADACRAFYDELWTERESLLQTKQLCFLLGAAFEIEKSRDISVADPQLIALLRYTLQHLDRFDGLLPRAWHPELFPEKDAPGLWSDLKALGDKPQDINTPMAFSAMRRSYVDRFGDPDAAGSPPPLEVNRFWYPKDMTGLFKIEATPLEIASDGVWISGVTEASPQSIIYHIAIDSSQPDPFTAAPPIAPPGIYADQMIATPDALYVLGSPIGQWQKSVVARFNFASRQWLMHDVPSSHQIFQAAGHFYLSLLGRGMDDLESGIARYDEETGEATVLASSRRKPGQNQFDDRDLYDVRGIFTGPGNLPCMLVGFGESYVISETPGPWQPLIDTGALEFAKTDGTRVLLYGPRSYKGKNPGDVVFMIDPAQATPELWLGGPVPSLGTGMVSKEGPEPAPWPKAPVWPIPQQGAISAWEYGFRGNDLFSYISNSKAAQNELVYYRRGSPEPILIPLDFKLDATTAQTLQAARERDPHYKFQPHNSGVQMTVVPQGICFSQPQGFWFLPFTEIDAYLKTHFQADSSSHN